MVPDHGCYQATPLSENWSELRESNSPTPAGKAGAPPLYQIRLWSPRRDLHPRPSHYKCDALLAELLGLNLVVVLDLFPAVLRQTPKRFKARGCVHRSPRGTHGVRFEIVDGEKKDDERQN